MAENSSSADLKAERDRDIRFPAKMNEFYIEIDPEPDYRHASIAAHEAFHDFKFGVSNSLGSLFHLEIAWQILAVLEIVF